MATEYVNILIKANDLASAKFKQVGHSATTLGITLKTAFAGIGAYIGIRTIKNFGKESLEAFGESESATTRMITAMSLLGPTSEKNIKDLKTFADKIEETTTVSDEAATSLMALGLSAGGLSGETLKKATIAAIGYSKALTTSGEDAEGFMSKISKAARGNMTAFTRYNIATSDTMTKQEKFNAILETGAKMFKLAEAETNDYLGKIKQMENAIHGVKAAVGSGLAPVFKTLADTIKTWAEDSEENIRIWTVNTITGLSKVGDGIYGLKVAWESLKLGGMKGAGNVARIAEDAKAIWKFIRGTDTKEAMKNEPKGGEKWSETIARVMAEQKKKVSGLLFDVKLPSEFMSGMYKKSKFKSEDYSGLGVGTEEEEDAAAKKVGGKRSGLAAIEARYLTMTTAKNKTEMNTTQLVTLAKSQLKLMEKLVEKTGAKTGLMASDIALGSFGM